MNIKRSAIHLFSAFALLTQAALIPVVFAASPEDADTQSTIPDETEDQQVIPLSAQEQLQLEQALLDKNKYEQIIEQLEIETGSNTYSEELTQAFLDLGETLQILNQHEEAAAVFDRALQTVRISYGLNSQLQLPILQQLFDSNVIQSDWEAADANSHLLFYVAQKNFPAGNEVRLVALKHLANWKVKVSNEVLLDRSDKSLRQVVELYENEIKQMEALPAEDKNLSLASLRLGEAETKLYLVRQIYERPLIEFQPSGQRSTTTTRCFFVRLPNGRMGQMCETIEVPRLEYYTEPNDRKSREISENLKDIREALLDTFNLLKTETGQIEKRDALIEEMQQITERYNSFVSEKSL